MIVLLFVFCYRGYDSPCALGDGLNLFVCNLLFIYDCLGFLYDMLLCFMIFLLCFRLLCFFGRGLL